MFETYDLKNFGARIRKIRKSLGYSQTQVSTETGVHRDTLRRIENGNNIVTFDTLNKLSMFFKKDLFHEIAHYNTNRNLLNYYEKIDDIISSYDYDKLINISNDFEVNFKDKSPSDFSLYEGGVIEQFRLIVKGIEKLIKKDQDNKKIMSIFKEALKLTLKDFNLYNFSKFKYNLFEIRILIMIAVALKRDNNYEKSNEILKFALKSLDFSEESLLNEKKLIIKCFSNISYNYHNMNNYMKSLEYAIKGIVYAINQDIIYALNHLYYRKGIAEYLLDKDESIYKDSLNKAIHILEIKGYYELAKKYKEITKDRYNIYLDR
ncbi:helix-turn-helix domain-containing protein [Senegalia massiliensis]|uniref:XRE family transcriptional regulator n=1 Tax=Senegalia massiliensis TaxID=1720316 RepID=A0A845R1J0_9CLOT|nr:helix-turn-helix domain-containing protein [Senegalia massiliensis]NBI06443.1 XRE family transcriptional regulator [Senegalia massiliensis]